MASDVWTMDRRSLSSNTGFVPQTLRLFEAAGFEKLIKPGDVVAIKLHCGEWNNSAYLRPVYARAVADEVKRLGGRPFVCDTTTMTYGPRAARVIAPDLMYTAERNGYSSATLGCPFLSGRRIQRHRRHSHFRCPKGTSSTRPTSPRQSLCRMC